MAKVFGSNSKVFEETVCVPSIKNRIHNTIWECPHNNNWGFVCDQYVADSEAYVTALFCIILKVMMNGAMDREEVSASAMLVITPFVTLRNASKVQM